MCIVLIELSLVRVSYVCCRDNHSGCGDEGSCPLPNTKTGTPHNHPPRVRNVKVDLSLGKNIPWDFAKTRTPHLLHDNLAFVTPHPTAVDPGLSNAVNRELVLFQQLAQPFLCFW